LPTFDEHHQQLWEQKDLSSLVELIFQVQWSDSFSLCDQKKESGKRKGREGRRIVGCGEEAFQISHWSQPPPESRF
jgi:hypothetical protein